MAERQENGRLKESTGFPLDVKAPIEAVAQRAYTPDNDRSGRNAFDHASRDIIFGNESNFRQFHVRCSLKLSLASRLLLFLF